MASEPTPVVPSRTLRCANAKLYAGFTLIVWAAAAYVMIFRDYGVWGHIGAVVAAVIALLWGGYYIALRYEVDSTGITRSLAGRATRILWADITRAELEERHTQEISNACLHLEAASVKMELGSDLFPLETVRDLAHDLSTSGILTTPLPENSQEEP